LGAELVDEMASILPLVQDRPHSFPQLQGFDERFEIRRALLTRFPYAIVFVVQPEEIRVLAVAHAKRRPQYWLSRLR
jgi:hypothetical protein